MKDIVFCNVLMANLMFFFNVFSNHLSPLCGYLSMMLSSQCTIETCTTELTIDAPSDASDEREKH